MMPLLLLSYAGAFLLSDDLKDIKFAPFGKEKPGKERAIEALSLIEQGKKVPEEIVELLKNVTGKIKVDNPQLLNMLKSIFPEKEFEVITSGDVLVRARELISEELAKIFGTREKYVEFANEVGCEIAREAVKEAGERRDQIVIKALAIFEDMTKYINSLVNHIREWYGLYFPELNKLVEDHELFLELIVNLTRHEAFTEENLRKFIKNERLIKEIISARETTAGARFRDDDLESVKIVAQRALDLIHERERLRNYIAGVMSEIAPNLTKIAGPIIAAKLLAKAGSLEDLAKLPASTIQVLGAEKALFRALAGRGTPPKHGIIFVHPLIQRAKWYLRGKIARTLAAKLAIAAKVDYYSGEIIADELIKDLERRFKELHEKYPKPPAEKLRKKRRRRARPRRKK